MCGVDHAATLGFRDQRADDRPREAATVKLSDSGRWRGYRGARLLGLCRTGDAGVRRSSRDGGDPHALAALRALPQDLQAHRVAGRCHPARSE
jgi:hypothetical protein